jgi:hypothetical protein
MKSKLVFLAVAFLLIFCTNVSAENRTFTLEISGTAPINFSGYCEFKTKDGYIVKDLTGKTPKAITISSDNPITIVLKKLDEAGQLRAIVKSEDGSIISNSDMKAKNGNIVIGIGEAKTGNKSDRIIFRELGKISESGEITIRKTAQNRI